MDPLIGVTLLNKYRVERLCTVEPGGVLLYEATDMFFDRCVCIKIARQEVLNDRDALERFQLEARDETAIDFGNIVGLPYFVVTDWERPTLKPPAPEDVEIPIYVEDERASGARAWASVALVVLVGLVSGAAGFCIGR